MKIKTDFWAEMLANWRKGAVVSGLVDKPLRHLNATECSMKEHYIDSALKWKSEELRKNFKTIKSTFDFEKYQIMRLQGGLVEARDDLSDHPDEIKKIEEMRAGISTHLKLIEDGFKKIQRKRENG